MEKIRSYNVGGSDYAKHSIQPWDVWEYIADPWRADIVKRLLRTKRCSYWDRCFHPNTCDSRLNDYKKIKHVLEKIDNLTKEGFVFPEAVVTTTKNTFGYRKRVLIKQITKEYKLHWFEESILRDMVNTPIDCDIEDCFKNINILIEVETQHTPKFVKLCNKIVNLFNKK